MCGEQKGGIHRSKIRAKELSGKKIFQPTQKEVKNVGSVIYKKVDSICKKRLGKSFGEVISMVPEDGLTKNVSPVEAKKEKKSVKKRESLKKTVENF